MSKHAAGPEIQRMIDLIARLPGLGPRSARRVALFLLKRKDTLLRPLSEALMEAANSIEQCGQCGNYDTLQPCAVCRADGRDDGRWSAPAFSVDAIMFSAVYCPLWMVSGRRI